MDTHDNDLKGPEAFTFRIQADRRKRAALVSGAHERRAASPPSVGHEDADAADNGVRPAWFEAIPERGG
jgi:hypothetical protein